MRCAHHYLCCQEEETAVAWSGDGGEQVQYGGMYYPSMPAAAVHYPMGTPVSMRLGYTSFKGKL